MGFKGKRTFIFILLLSIILFGFQMLVSYRNNYYEEIEYVAKIDNNLIEDNKEEVNKILELRRQYSNEDITGFISIDDVDINEPVLKYKDNDYYLHHDNYGKYEINGSIFQDYRINLSDRKVLIYGHSSIYDDIPFNNLEKYYSKDFYDKHRYINLITENDIYKYEIFSVYVETSDFTYMNLKISDDTYNEMLKKYVNKSLYDTGVKVSDNDEIIILQTCSNDSRYSRYKKKFLLVIGKKIFKEG